MTRHQFGKNRWAAGGNDDKQPIIRKSFSRTFMSFHLIHDSREIPRFHGYLGVKAFRLQRLRKDFFRVLCVRSSRCHLIQLSILDSKFQNRLPSSIFQRRNPSTKCRFLRTKATSIPPRKSVRAVRYICFPISRTCVGEILLFRLTVETENLASRV